MSRTSAPGPLPGAVLTACTSTVSGTATPADAAPHRAPGAAAPGVIPSPEPGTEGTIVEVESTYFAPGTVVAVPARPRARRPVRGPTGRGHRARRPRERRRLGRGGPDRRLGVPRLPDLLHRATGTYDLEGYLRLALDPTREREVLAANGFAGMYTRLTDPDAGGTGYTVSVFRFPDSAATNAVYSTFAELEGAAFETTPFVLPSIPEAPCFSLPSQSGDGSFTQRCYVGYGSHLASVDVSGLAAPDDIAEMDRLLPLQRDLIDG